MDLFDSVSNAARAVRAGERSAQDLVSECLGRIARRDAGVHAWLSCDQERSMAKARELDAARARGEVLGPLAGVPLAVKDNLCTSFGTTTCGSRMLEGFHANYDAFAIERLESAGAVIVGKVNLDEFAMGSSTEHSAFGVTRNPWNGACVAGGSSGGPAAAVAAGMVPAAVGSDTGGSVRLPASFCGVSGLKPTYGRVSRYGLVAFGSSLDQIGPIAAEVGDIALLLRVIAGFDPRDSTCVDKPVPDYAAALDRPVQGLRIGVCQDLFGEGLSEEVRAATRAAIDLMCAEGARIVPVDLPHARYGIAAYYLIATAEASSNLARYDGVHYGWRTENPLDIIDLYASTRADGFGAEVKRRIMLGTFALSAGYYDAYYLKASKVRTLIKRDFEEAFKQADVIASPVAPTTAFKIGERTEDPLAMYLEDIYTITANLAGICALSIPCGFDAQGLPIGLQLLGPAFGEETLLAAAHQYQLRTDHHRRKPPVASSDGTTS